LFNAPEIDLEIADSQADDQYLTTKKSGIKWKNPFTKTIKSPQRTSLKNGQKHYNLLLSDKLGYIYYYKALEWSGKCESKCIINTNTSISINKVVLDPKEETCWIGFASGVIWNYDLDLKEFIYNIAFGYVSPILD
jgi:hypothetical protein